MTIDFYLTQSNSEIVVDGIEVSSKNYNNINDLLKRFECKSVDELNANMIDEVLMEKYHNTNYIITLKPN